MADSVASAYDGVADVYASLFLRDLADDADAQPWFAAFVDLVDSDMGPVIDVGCGPGHGVAALVEAGVRAFGIDLSAGQLEQARAAFPDGDYRLGDLACLETADGSLAGIFSRYSIIHVPPDELPAVFSEWARALAPGAPALVSFFAAATPAAHGSPFDHKVTTAHALSPKRVGDLLVDAGFVEVRTGTAPPAAGGRPLDRGSVLARRSR